MSAVEEEIAPDDEEGSVMLPVPLPVRTPPVMQDRRLTFEQEEAVHYRYDSTRLDGYLGTFTSHVRRSIVASVLTLSIYGGVLAFAVYGAFKVVVFLASHTSEISTLMGGGAS